MANAPVFSLLLFFSTVSLLSSTPNAVTLKTPFHPRDLLPFLPRELSWPILNSLHSAVDLLPTFVGAVSSTNNISEWKGACFYDNHAWMEFHNKTGSQYGGGTLHIKVCDFFLVSGSFCFDEVWIKCPGFRVLVIWWVL